MLYENWRYVENRGRVLVSTTSGADSGFTGNWRAEAALEEGGELSEWDELCSVVQVNMASAFDPDQLLRIT